MATLNAVSAPYVIALLVMSTGLALAVPFVSATTIVVIGIGLFVALSGSSAQTPIKVTVLIIPFVALLRRLAGGEDAYTPNDPLILLSAVMLLPVVIAALRQPDRSPPAFWWFAGWLAVSAVNGVAQGGLPAALFALVTQGLPFAAALAMLQSRWMGDVARFMIRSLYALGPVVALYGVVQWVAPPAWDLAWLRARQDVLISFGLPRPGEFRIFGPAESPGTFAAFLSLSAIALVVILVKGRLAVATRVWVMAGLSIVVFGLALSGVRTALFAVPVALAATLPFHRSKGRAVAIAVIVVLAVSVVTLPRLVAASSGGEERYDIGELADDESFQARSSLLPALGAAIVSNPLGDGLGTAGQASGLSSGQTSANIDNGYLQRTLETGLVGLLLFLVIMLKATAVGLRSLQQAEGARAVTSITLFAVVAAFLFFDLSGPLTASNLSLYFWIAVAGLTGVSRPGEHEQEMKLRRGSPSSTAQSRHQ
ncbi:O-antigen ligase family protein [Blastococcus sp. CCUG 61487]|uniref:O-antigen ligase family protein n=1 Tax=Blastococcus sp. CCUG 61487 TaxID=1840703 RepID=UPI0010C0B355|nr:O-antigen ligase family protein [Blastococcus sp. CCUG 61487]